MGGGSEVGKGEGVRRGRGESEVARKGKERKGREG